MLIVFDYFLPALCGNYKVIDVCAKGNKTFFAHNLKLLLLSILEDVADDGGEI